MPIYYLSFQRAPPVSVSPDDSIHVCPTIVNDLRDDVHQPEVESAPLRIYLAWVVRKGNVWSKISVEEEQIWNGPLTAYKQCPVKVPSHDALKSAKVIHLALWVAHKSNDRSSKRRKNSAQEWTFDIGDIASLKEDRFLFVPVLSAPVDVTNKASGKGSVSKSSTMTRLFRMAGSQNIEICEESGYELDKHIWDASLLLSSYLSKVVTQGATDTLFTASRNLRVIELGAGTGMVTILLSILLAKASADTKSKEGYDTLMHLTATDLPSALPILRRNIDLNRDGAHGDILKVDCQALDWSEEYVPEKADLILVSDCTYNPTYFKVLCRTIRALLDKGESSAKCLLAKKHRHSDEESLWSEVEELGLRASLLVGRQAVEEGKWGLWKLEIAP